MKHLDLFSGIGGFALAAYWVWGDEHEVVAFCEQDKFCQQILKKHWPTVPIVEDVEDVRSIKGYCPSTVDLLTGGFPCQGFSIAGKRRGKKDDRYLWPEMFEVIKAARPRWVIGENVTGIVNMALDTVLSDLETEGYTCQAFIIPACAQDAPHRRDRVWIVANTELFGWGGWRDGDAAREVGSLQVEGSVPAKEQPYVAHTQTRENNRREGGDLAKAQRQRASLNSAFDSGSQDVAYAEGEQSTPTNSRRNQEAIGGAEQREYRGGSGEGDCREWLSQPRVGIPDDGFPRWLVRAWGTGKWEEGIPRVTQKTKDRVNKLKALGNAICIPTVMPIMQAIKDIEVSNGNTT